MKHLTIIFIALSVFSVSAQDFDRASYSEGTCVGSFLKAKEIGLPDNRLDAASISTANKLLAKWKQADQQHGKVAKTCVKNGIGDLTYKDCLKSSIPDVKASSYFDGMLGANGLAYRNLDVKGYTFGQDAFLKQDKVNTFINHTNSQCRL